jgi:Flp pilus assembly protein TadD
MPIDIFVSYRRSDAAGHARLLHKDLAQFFDAERIFFDRESIESGADFPETLRRGVSEAKVVVAVIAPHWLLAADAAGNRRLNDPTDFVRIEIALALAQAKTVIPVLVDDAAMPDAASLPDELKPLAGRDALTLRGKNYEYDRQLAELVRLIAATAGIGQPRSLPRGMVERPFRGADQVLSPHFCGRDAELVVIEETFTPEASDRPIAVALHGMAGSGKTQVALRYFLKHAPSYAGVWWLRAQSSELMDEDFRALARGCEVPRADEREPVRDAVRRWLERQPRWLLVFDNAKSAKDISGALPARGTHHVLITSRNPSWGALARSIEVRPWSAQLASEFLRRRFPDASEEARQALSESLGGLPLALEQAAGYCEEVGVGLNEYRARLEEAGARLLGKGPLATGYPDSVPRTVSVAFERLSLAAAQLMQYLAWFAPEPVPDTVFFAKPDLLPSALREATASEVDFDDVVAELRRLGLAERPGGSGQRGLVSRTLRLHRLTRAVVRELSTDSEIVVPAVVGLLRAASPDWKNPVMWPRWSELMPHALEGALEERAEVLAPAAFADIRDSLGGYQLATGLVADAVQSFRAALALRARVLGDQHPDTLVSMTNLGASLKAQGDVAGARSLHERALEANRWVLGEEHSNTLTTMGNLAESLFEQGDIAGARALQEQMLEASRRRFGEEHPVTLTSMNNLAESLRARGDVAGAQRLHEHALEAFRRVRGEEHPDTLGIMHNLAESLRVQGDLAGARTLHERVFEARQRGLGEEHPDTLRSMNNLALTLFAQGDVAGARALHERVLDRGRHVFGEEHPETLRMMTNLAVSLAEQGDVAGAQRLHEHVTEKLRRVLGEEHPDTLMSMNSLSEALRAQGQVAGARALQESVLEVRRRVLGEEHPDTLTSMNNLAESLFAQGDEAGAEALQERVLQAGRRVFGEEHPNTLTTMGNLSLTLFARGDVGGARVLQERVLEASRRVLGEEHPATLRSMENLAVSLFEQGDVTAAPALEERVLETRRRMLGEEHPDTLSSMHNLAASLQAQDDLGGARTLEERVLEGFRRLLGEEHPETLVSMNKLAELLGEEGDVAGARALHEQVLAAR